jgi:hypothetical protein
MKSEELNNNGYKIIRVKMILTFAKCFWVCFHLNFYYLVNLAKWFVDSYKLFRITFLIKNYLFELLSSKVLKGKLTKRLRGDI